MNFIRKLNRGNFCLFFIFRATYLKFDDLLGVIKLAINAKFQHNISKVTSARPKTQGMGHEYHYK